MSVFFSGIILSLKSAFRGLKTDHAILVNEPEGEEWKVGKRTNLHFKLEGKLFKLENRSIYKTHHNLKFSKCNYNTQYIAWFSFHPNQSRMPYPWILSWAFYLKRISLKKTFSQDYLVYYLQALSYSSTEQTFVTAEVKIIYFPHSIMFLVLKNGTHLEPSP